MPIYRNLPRFAPQVPPIPSYPPCYRSEQTKFCSFSHIQDTINYKFRKPFSKTLNNLSKPIQFGKTKTFGKSPRFCQIVSRNPQSPCYQRYQKTQKSGIHPT